MDSRRRQGPVAVTRKTPTTMELVTAPVTQASALRLAPRPALVQVASESLVNPSQPTEPESLPPIFKRADYELCAAQLA